MSHHTRAEKVKNEFDTMAQWAADSGVRGTFLFFGSARAPSREQFDAGVAKHQQVIGDEAATAEAKANAKVQLAKLQRMEWACEHWANTKELARLLSEWAISEEGVAVGRAVPTNFPEGNSAQPLVVCSGGGPGFMEASNAGAAQVPGSRNMGVGVELPFEARLNDHLTEELAITADTFFGRKYWEVFCAKAMIVCPGGVGTCDELFEVLTLQQCQKGQQMPVVLLGKEFWTTAVNLRYMASKGMMTDEEIDALCFTDDPKEACDFIVGHLRAEAAARQKAE